MTTILLDLLWGDCGKGRIVDLIADDYDIVARYNGGNNSGHVIYQNNKKLTLHLIPSGVLYPEKQCVIGNGVVIDPKALMNEIQMLESNGISIQDRLHVSNQAHVIMPYHIVLDKLSEAAKGSNKIGTTGRGIGPAYADKISRCGITIDDLTGDKNVLLKKIISNLKTINPVLTENKLETLNAIDICNELEPVARQIAKFSTNTSHYLNEAIRNGKRVLCESAQGTLLDIDHGTYPFTTSSNCTSGGACTGLGIPPTKITKVIGVTKAYSTRVGSGPFPTELNDDIGNSIREKGKEFGATTGRPRRVGWIDLVALKYAIEINGVTSIALTKLDILSELKEIKVCVGYKLGNLNTNISTFIQNPEILSQCEPIYETIEGWMEDITGITKIEDLPEKAYSFITNLQIKLGVPINIVGTGHERNHAIVI